MGYVGSGGSFIFGCGRGARGCYYLKDFFSFVFVFHSHVLSPFMFSVHHMMIVSVSLFFLVPLTKKYQSI